MTRTPVASSGHFGPLPTTATIGALGVVYGDIGTSPLYALKEAAKAATHGGALTPESMRSSGGIPRTSNQSNLAATES